MKQNSGTERSTNKRELKERIHAWTYSAGMKTYERWEIQVILYLWGWWFNPLLIHCVLRQNI